jgi:Ser/Thr protein kinase RdoA (MazF antagonist)
MGRWRPGGSVVPAVADHVVVDRVLEAWGPLRVIGRLGGGNRNEVLEVRRGDQRLVARRSRRSAASLSWEVRLLEHLARSGIRVPVVVPTVDGRWHVDGVVVMQWLEGRPPQTGDWPAVAAALRGVHGVTRGWPQRPGAVSTRDLSTAQRGGDVDLGRMPVEAVAACRRAWAALAGSAEAVVHGDPGPANIRITAAGVGLLDWDEARVDVTDLDLAELPGSDLHPQRLAVVRAAATAWETANGWTVEPSYARRQLALLRAGRDNFS